MVWAAKQPGSSLEEKKEKEGEGGRRSRSRGVDGTPRGADWPSALITAKRAIFWLVLLGSFCRRRNNASVGYSEAQEPDPWDERTSETRSPSRHSGSWM